jgi:hypothetical protein
MSIMTHIESEFQAIVNDGRSVAEKLASLFELHKKSQELTALEPQIIAIINNGDPIESKVEAIVAAIGKL